MVFDVTHGTSGHVVFFILQLVCYYPDPLLGFDITWDFMPGHQSFLMPSCSGIFDTLGTGTPKWFISIKMTHCLFRCVQLASKWLFVSLPDHTTFGNQSLLFFVVGKENIDCNRNQVSVDEWVLVSCRSSSPVTVSIYFTDPPTVALMWLMTESG